MGLYNVIALGTELAVLSWYVAIPLANGCSSLLRDDYARFWEFRQSLAATAVLAVVRGACFVYVRLSSKRAPATRCFVFFVFLIQGLICALSALQPLVFWRDPSSFKRYRAYDWGSDFVYTLAALTLLSSALQIVYVFQLNKNRGRLADDGLLGDVLLGETDAKLAVWQTKWSQLVKHIKRRQTDPTFEAIVRLYAQRDGAVERLKTEFDRDPTEFEFYLPQLCSFLLLGNYAQSPQLCMMLLEKCSVSHVFAHRMLWYLQSYCLKNAAFASEESTSRIQMLIDEVSSRGMKPAKASEKPAQATTCFSGSDEKTGAYSATIAPAASSEVEALLPSKEGEHYFTFTIKPPIDLERGNASVDPFQQESAFLSALAGVSSNLRTVPLTRRNDMLRTWLEDIQTQFLPSNSLYVPVGNWHHRIKRIHVTESFTFSTRERVPFLLCAEVVDYTTPEEDKKLGRKRSSIFRGRRFTLGLWEKAALSVRNHTLTSSSDRAPPTSPESGALGFWSESKPGASPRQRSASHPSDLWNGLLDTIVKKNPLSRNGSYNTPHHAKGTNQEALLSDSHPASPTASGYQKQRSLRHSTGTNTSKRSLTIDTSSGEKDERVSSDRREELWSPRSDGPLSPHSPSSPYLARCDSTDMFLRTLSERDSKEVDDEESALPPLASGRADVPAVIFKERWSEKENRVRGSSPWSSSPGWRLLPVIVKSDDDLRQEQLASQMIKQFSKVFADAKLPVFMRPYDVIAISGTSGLVEAIADTISIDSLKRNDPEYTTLLDFFYRHFGDESSSEFRMARNNFVSSMAAYSIVCYLLQIKDRHNGNILLDAEGHIIHIDFGFMLANNPGNVGFEQAPFKLTAEFVELMGGPRSASFRRFRSLCVRAFLVARKYRHRFTLLLEMMINGNENLPCFAGDPRGAIDRLAARFQPQLDINACEDFVHALIDASLDNWRTKWYDKYQRWCVGVF